jgi:hypothetical protein
MGVRTGPSAEEIATIRSLVTKAGIDPTDWRVTG